MIENTLGMINPTDLIKTRRGHSKRGSRKPKTQARKLYEESFPAISVRVEKGTKLQFLLDAKIASLTEKEYLTALIHKSNLNINKITNDAFEAGKKSMEPLITAEYKRGLQDGVTADAEKIRQRTIKEVEKRSAISFRCANHVHGCTSEIPIQRLSKFHLIAALALEQYRFICPGCHYREIMRKYEEPPTPPKPSWCPEYYPWPPPPSSPPP